MACVDLPTMGGILTALYYRLEKYVEIAMCYGSLEEALIEEKHRGDQLMQKLNTLRDVKVKLRSYVQQLFYRLFSAFQHARQRGDDCAVILGK